MINYTEKQLERMVYSTKWYRRHEAAKHGYGLDVLVDDEHPLVRAAVAEQGFGLEKLLHDENDFVRLAVAQQGYRLDVTVKEMWDQIRKAAAEQGYQLDQLINDHASVVRAAARAYVFERLPIEYQDLVYVPLADIGLSRRIVNALLPDSPGGLRTVGDLMMTPAEKLEQVAGLGEKSHRDIQEKFVAFFEEVKASPCGFGVFAKVEDIFDALRVEIEKVVMAPVDDEKWFMRTVFSRLEKQGNRCVEDLIADATLRSGSTGAMAKGDLVMEN